MILEIPLVILCSPSGAGKTTLAHKLLEDPMLPGIHFSVSHTTRETREGEQDGRDYHFVDEDRFRRFLEAGGFAEHATVHGNLYGTSVAEIERIAALPGARAIVFDIDYQGARQIKERYPRAISIMILPPSLGELKARLAKRGTESPEELSLRLHNAMEEVGQYKQFDSVIVNDELAEAYEKLRDIVRHGGAGKYFDGAAAESLLGELGREVQR